MTTTAQRIADLVDRGAAAGTSLLGMLDQLQIQMPRRVCCSCDIPPPCWMPRQLRDVTSCVCAGGSAVLRLRVENCSAQTSSVAVDVVGDANQSAQVTPATLTLVPFQRGTITVTVATGAGDPAGDHELLVRVHGCVEHVLRWTIRVGKRGRDSCHEIDVEDCPDYVHHWYDHFYCPRPCGHARDPGTVVTHG
jgi:hypothetical protein